MAQDPTPLRIVSLLPATTEIACALGLGGQLVGRSHECDVPPDVAAVPALTSPRLDTAASGREIHEAVGRAVGGNGGAGSLFALDADRLAAAAPDLILTQAACEVCAVSAEEVHRVAGGLPRPARVVAVNPSRLRDVLDDILAIGRETGRLPKARELVARLQARIDSVACRVRSLGGRPRVAVVEWLDPPMAAGNWVPELVALAGGIDVLGRAGERSHWISWDDLAEADPDAVVLAPCGFTLERVVEEASRPACHTRIAAMRAAREGRVVAVDGHHLFNRPGPRLVDSLEVLAEILHPGAFRFPATSLFARAIGR